jgi:hypothetical protein
MSQIEQVKKEAVQQVSDELAKQPKQDEDAATEEIKARRADAEKKLNDARTADATTADATT